MGEPAQPETVDKRSWFDAVAAYGDRRVAAMLALGFSSGLPLVLIFATMSRWLAEVGVSRTDIAVFSLVGLAYGFKFVWAPAVDHVPLPGLRRALGRRRSWILFAQAGVIVGIVGMALTDPATALGTMAVFAVVTAFSSATQDIAIDAWRIESAPEEMQGAMAGAYQLGYRLAVLAGGAGVFFIVAGIQFDFPAVGASAWRYGYLAMAGAMLVGVVTILVAGEPKVHIDAKTEHMEEAIERRAGGGAFGKAVGYLGDAVVLPFVDFFKRNGWIGLLILAFIGTYWLSDQIWGVLAQPFYFDMGYTKVEVGIASKTFGLFVTIAGALLGGVLVARVGVMRMLLFSATLAAASNLLFAGLALYVEHFGKSFPLLFVAIGLENIFGGMAGTVLIAYLSGLTNVAYTGTQYALFTSFMVLPGKFIAAGSGWVVDTVGYVTFFIYTAAAGLPAIVLVFLLMRYARAREPAEVATAEAEVAAPGPAQ